MKQVYAEPIKKTKPQADYLGDSQIAKMENDHLSKNPITEKCSMLFKNKKSLFIKNMKDSKKNIEEQNTQYEESSSQFQNFLFQPQVNNVKKNNKTIDRLCQNPKLSLQGRSLHSDFSRIINKRKNLIKTKKIQKQEKALASWISNPILRAKKNSDKKCQILKKKTKKTGDLFNTMLLFQDCSKFETRLRRITEQNNNPERQNSWAMDQIKKFKLNEQLCNKTINQFYTNHFLDDTTKYVTNKSKKLFGMKKILKNIKTDKEYKNSVMNTNIIENFEKKINLKL